MDKNFIEIEKIFGKNRIRKDEPMNKHTTFRIGGPAQYYIEVEKTDDFVKAVNTSGSLKIPYLILGGGSNILVSDSGVRGLVIKNNCRAFSVMRMSGRIKNNKIDVDSAFLFSESGVIMNQLVRFSIEEGLGGLEYMLGLPGTAGGAVFMNSNFPKKESYVGDSLYSAKILTKTGEVKEVDRSYFKFGYDKSALQKTEEIVLSVIFKLVPGEKKVLWEKATEALEYRTKTQPKGFSAGCVFRNISIVDAIKIPTPDRITSAGYLIDKAGLKGKRVGNAIVSDIHANYILNTGNARASDVLNLIAFIKQEVFKKFGVELSLEIRKIGF
ncbi:MAG: UDP-N-acetylmuramate dehydrogenase [Patescibacteria group bacterium]|nr:UDP-N-acetylmuramate dehydrogenase [Patescibacteria group bacterium]